MKPAVPQNPPPYSCLPLAQVHHIGLLLGYGVDAICPYLAFETLAALQVLHPLVVHWPAGRCLLVCDSFGRSWLAVCGAAHASSAALPACCPCAGGRPHPGRPVAGEAGRQLHQGAAGWAGLPGLYNEHFIFKVCGHKT